MIMKVRIFILYFLVQIVLSQFSFASGNKTGIPEGNSNGEFEYLWNRLIKGSIDYFSSHPPSTYEEAIVLKRKMRYVEFFRFNKIEEAVETLLNNITLRPAGGFSCLPGLMGGNMPCVQALIAIGKPASQATIERISTRWNEANLLEKHMYIAVIFNIESPGSAIGLLNYHYNIQANDNIRNAIAFAERKMESLKEEEISRKKINQTNIITTPEQISLNGSDANKPFANIQNQHIQENGTWSTRDLILSLIIGILVGIIISTKTRALRAR